MYNIDRGDTMSNSILRDKAKTFAKNIVFLCRNMKTEQKDFAISPLRTSTLVGALFLV